MDRLQTALAGIEQLRVAGYKLCAERKGKHSMWMSRARALGLAEYHRGHGIYRR